MPRPSDSTYTTSMPAIPNGVGGTPEDFYDQALAEELLAYMETVLTFVAGQFEL